MTRTPPEVTEVAGTDDHGRVWSQTTIKVNLGDYESMEVSVGASVPLTGPATDARIKRTHEKLHKVHMQLLSERVEEIREAWSNK